MIRYFKVIGDKNMSSLLLDIKDGADIEIMSASQLAKEIGLAGLEEISKEEYEELQEDSYTLYSSDEDDDWD